MVLYVKGILTAVVQNTRREERHEKIAYPHWVLFFKKQSQRIKMMRLLLISWTS